MNAEVPRVIKLIEYQPFWLPKGALSEEEGVFLWQNYSPQVDVDFPSPKTNNQWKLTSKGWIGCIPLRDDIHIVLQPKVELSNLFEMLEYAYNLKSIEWLEGITECQALEDFYERLASILSRRILDRGRKGFYRTYLSRTEELPFLRGRLDLHKIMRKPWEVQLRCHYEEHTSDIEENQILCWTLFNIARSGICTERVLPTIRRAYRSLVGLTSLLPFGGQDCINREYNRLNDDYQPMHVLCRFFLENSGPTHEVGDKQMIPFLVNMERLYELFIAEWLKAHLPDHLTLHWQDSVTIDAEGYIRFNIDMVLQDIMTGDVTSVIDAKYKAADHPSNDDIAQIVTYAAAKDCQEAVLVYPTALARPFKSKIGQIKVQSLTFALAGNLSRAGMAFVNDLLRSNPG